MRPGDLIWIRYNSKYYLLVHLGEKDNLTIGLVADQVPDNEITTIKQNLKAIRASNTKGRTSWVKDHAPTSYKKAMRSFKTEQVDIVKTYQMEA